MNYEQKTSTLHALQKGEMTQKLHGEEQEDFARRL